ESSDWRQYGSAFEQSEISSSAQRSRRDEQNSASANRTANSSISIAYRGMRVVCTPAIGSSATLGGRACGFRRCTRIKRAAGAHSGLHCQTLDGDWLEVCIRKV